MNERTSRVELQYRPASDVLIGRIDLPADVSAGDVVEHPDADLELVWRSGVDGDLLSGFEILHASWRLAAADVTDIDPGVLDIAAHLVVVTENDIAAGPPVDAAAAFARREITSVEVPWSALRRRRPRTDAADLDAEGARDLARSVARLASNIAAQPTPVTDVEAARVAHLVIALRELADAIDDGHGRTAPGASAAARDAVRGGVPLSRTEQQLLRSALHRIDRPHEWSAVVDDLDSLAAPLDPAPHRTDPRS